MDSWFRKPGLLDLGINRGPCAMIAKVSRYLHDIWQYFQKASSLKLRHSRGPSHIGISTLAVLGTNIGSDFLLEKILLCILFQGHSSGAPRLAPTSTPRSHRRLPKSETIHVSASSNNARWLLHCRRHQNALNRRALKTWLLVVALSWNRT